jgi:hypothetical protein
VPIERHRGTLLDPQGALLFDGLDGRVAQVARVVEVRNACQLSRTSG